MLKIDLDRVRSAQQQSMCSREAAYRHIAKQQLYEMVDSLPTSSADHHVKQALRDIISHMDIQIR